MNLKSPIIEKYIYTPILFKCQNSNSNIMLEKFHNTSASYDTVPDVDCNILLTYTNVFMNYDVLGNLKISQCKHVDNITYLYNEYNHKCINYIILSSINHKVTIMYFIQMLMKSKVQIQYHYWF